MEDRYNVECCDFIHAHEEIVERVRQELPDVGEDTVILPFSSKDGEGVEQLREIMDQLVSFCAEHPELLPTQPEEAAEQPQTAEDEEVTVEYIGFDEE